MIKYNHGGINCGQRKGVVVGEEENRRSVDIFESNKANYRWLNGDYLIIVMSTIHHARFRRVEAFVIAWTR